MQIIDQIRNIYIHYLRRLVSFSVYRPRFVITLSLGAAVISLIYAAFNLPINSEQEHLVARDNIFLKRAESFSQAFPQQDHTILAIVSGENPWRVGKNAERLAQALEARPDLFKSVFYPQGMQFFHQNGLLYLDIEALTQFVDGLAEAQPAMAELAKDPNLRGLWGLLAEGLKNEATTPLPESFNEIIKRLNIATEDFISGRYPSDPWVDAFPDWHVGGKKQKETIQMIIVQPHLEFSNILSGKRGIDSLRQIAAALDFEKQGVRLMLTGREPLTFDELASAVLSVKIAALVSTVMIIIILGFGIGSWRTIAMIMSVLFVGMSWSLGWAALAVGELNMISVAFVVLFLGLCVDFAIHVALRYREEYHKTGDMNQAMAATVEGAGGPVSLCALATMIGFASFVPTEFFALRDLGIIAAGSMLLALGASWTLLPALLCFLPEHDLKLKPKARPNIISRFSSGLYEWIRSYFRAISITAVLLGVAALPVAMQMAFDHSTLAIKDPSSESIVALKLLQRHGLYTNYTASLLTENREQAISAAARFAQLPLIRRVETHAIYVPTDQAQKIDLISEAAFFMIPVLTAIEAPEALANEDFARSARALRKQLAAKKTRDPLPPEQERLGQMLATLLRQPPEQISQFNRALMGDYTERLDRLGTSLTAKRFTFDDLPNTVRAQYQAADGRIKITIYPKEDMTDPAALRRFVEAVSAEPDQVGGRPLVEYAVSQITVRSFQMAIGLALIMISLILLVSLGSLKKTLLVLAPIALAGVWTLALCVWFGISFNFVNVLLLPLLLGLGVANGIHILSRTEKQETIREVMHSSTPVAVFLSNTTTLASFGSMVLATHLGLRSMGLTLTIAMVLMILAALIVLPAMLAWSRYNRPLTPK